jgi:serine/threonine-protein kinase
MWAMTRPAPVESPLVEATILPPTSEPSLSPAFAVSDRYLAFVAGATRQLFIRPLAASEPTQVAGASDTERPFFSHDERWLAFFSGRDKRLKKVPVGGGPASEICSTDGLEGADWGPAGIVFSERRQGLSIVSPDTGARRLVLAVGKDTFFQDPVWLPDGRSILYTEVGRLGTGDVDLSVAKVMRVSIASGATPEKVTDGHGGRFVAPHGLVFQSNRSLVSMRFDPASGAASGSPETVRTDVGSFAVSPGGTLVCRPDVSLGLTFVWVDQHNHIEPTGIEPQPYRYPRISPDGTRIVMSSAADDRDLWTWDLRQKSLSRLTREKGADGYPVWTPDSLRVIYAGATKGADENLMIRAADTTGGPETLLASDRHQTPYTISPDGGWVVFRDEVPGHGTDLGLLDMRTHEAKPLLFETYNERNAEISPDGRWLAYQSDETGKFEVYVRPFPNVNSGKRQVSNGGGIRPVWSHDKRHLFYSTHYVLPATMNVVERKGDGLDFGPPEVVFDLAPFTSTSLNGRTYDVGADGRFLMPKSVSDGATQPGLIFVLNWAQHLAANR